MRTALARKPSTEIAVPGEFAFTWADFEVVAEMLYGDSGIVLGESKVTLAYSRLAKRVRILGLPDFAAYCDLLQSPEGESERSAMLSALTTNVTRFFREPHHFDHLRDQSLPRIAEAARAGRRIRLWSAGCSAGHEPYSIAMTLLEVLPEAASLDIRILASDIDPVIVRRAEAGVYSAEDVEPVPAPLRGRYLTRSGADWTPTDEVRGLIAFRTLNLLGDWPMKHRLDIIFCRNVAIYFDDATQTRLFQRFAESMQDGGHLYIGHSERTFATGLTPDGLTAYRREPRGA